MRLSPSTLLLSAILAGVLTGFMPFATVAVTFVADAFIHLLKLVSLPIIFLSLVTTASNVNSFDEFKHLGRKTFQYAALTTFLAAAVALGLYMLTTPRVIKAAAEVASVTPNETGYLTYLLKAIPSNLLQPFLEHNVLGVLFIAALISFAILHLPEAQRTPLKLIFNSLYAVIMKVTSWVVVLMPLGVWAFVATFVKELQQGLSMQGLGVYLAIIVLANLVQAFVVLPLILKRKGLRVRKLAKVMFPAITTAFFSKSSAAAMPLAISCVEKGMGTPSQVARFCFPLCTSINMNACAAFILITVLFVAQSEGVVFSPVDFAAWVLIATITAFGNAGVPMGCFFIATSLLTTLNVPLTLLGLILPFYALLDMLESAINIWSDACVTSLVAESTSQNLAQQEAA